MKYYLIEISTGESAIAGKAIYEYETLNNAVANFHSKLGSAMKSDLFESEMVMVINGDGSVFKVEKYNKPYVAPEPTPIPPTPEPEVEEETDSEIEEEPEQENEETV